MYCRCLSTSCDIINFELKLKEVHQGQVQKGFYFFDKGWTKDSKNLAKQKKTQIHFKNAF